MSGGGKVQSKNLGKGISFTPGTSDSEAPDSVVLKIRGL
ncbi:MAG: hypothetical protein JWP03_3693, partial [Phycisphaerales bacterium]|nr:hypothetical protein [Phycisphaerales bacterium]